MPVDPRIQVRRAARIGMQTMQAVEDAVRSRIG
jgi:hypothetical protein